MHAATRWLRDCALFGLKAVLVLLWFCWETNGWLIPGSILIMLLGLPIGGVYLAWKDPPRTTHRVFGWLAAGLLVFPAAQAFHEWQTKASERRAAPIIAALEACRRQTGEYPASLEALQPRFITDLPEPAFGLLLPYRYHYNQRVEEGHRQYWLSFGVGVMCEDMYSSLFPRWNVVD